MHDDQSTRTPPLLVDEREARRLLGGLAPKTLYLLRKNSGLPHVKIGSRVMYRPEDLAKWIEGGKAVQG